MRARVVTNQDPHALTVSVTTTVTRETDEKLERRVMLYGVTKAQIIRAALEALVAGDD